MYHANKVSLNHFFSCFKTLRINQSNKKYGYFSIAFGQKTPGKELNGCESFQSSALSQAKTIMYYLRQMKPE